MPGNPAKQLYDFFGITAVLERLESLEGKIDHLTDLVQGTTSGPAQRVDSLEARMDLVESAISRIQDRIGHVEGRLDGVAGRREAR